MFLQNLKSKQINLQNKISSFVLIMHKKTKTYLFMFQQDDNKLIK